MMQDDAIAELRAENSCMQVEIGQLEEQQKNLKAHLRFHAKHGNQIPVELELTADQLTKVADFVQELKGKQQVICKVAIMHSYSDCPRRSHCCNQGACRIYSEIVYTE